MNRAFKLPLLIGLLTGLAGLAACAPPARTEGRVTASLRSEPTNYIRYFGDTAASDVVSRLTDGRLIRLDRISDAVEPGLAERWTQSADGLTYTLALRRDVRFSDGQPFTSADVLFSARVLYDATSRLAAATLMGGKPLVFAAPDPWTVTVTMPAPFAPGLRLLDNLPILPRHKLEAALNENRLLQAWRVGAPPGEITGLGPFILKEHVAGQRMVFERNPHYWRRDSDGKMLPYLEGITLVVVQDQNTEALRLGAGEIDLMVNGDIRPEDHARFKRAADQGRLVLHEAGIGTDPNLLWFNLTEGSRPRLDWLHDTRVRQAISHAVDRQAIVNTVYLGAAVPIHGPVTPGNRTWHSPTAPQYPHDPKRARLLLAEAGLQDRNDDGIVEDTRGRPVRFSILTASGNTPRERTVTLIQAHLKDVGVAVDVAMLDQKGVRERLAAEDYDASYFGVQATSLDPALSLQFWLSSGPFHFWNPLQKKPATPWEAEIDSLMQRQAVATTLAERQELFAEVQRIIGQQVPAIYFVAPRVTVAVSSRLRNVTPVAQPPHVLWNADMLALERR